LRIGAAVSYVARDIRIRDTDEIAIFPFEDDQTSHGIIGRLRGVEELDEDEGIDGSAPSAFAVHA
jgi:hypothetical protein